MNRDQEMPASEQPTVINRETHIGPNSKIEHYGWTIVDKPGVAMDVDKHDLIIDHSYQRQPNTHKCQSYAAAWSWVACGSIIVAKRSRQLFVIDGQHRVLAARRRTDIILLPCLVFETVSPIEEASNFLTANTNRRPIPTFDRYRALIVTGDPAALLVQDLCESVGRDVSASDSPRAIRCVGRMLMLARTDTGPLVKIWPLANELMDDQVISERLLVSLVLIERQMPEGQSLTDRRWSDRILSLGAAAFTDGIFKAVAFYGSGGEKIWAKGFLRVLNRGLRHRLLDTDDK
jgi:hypothetical protein